MRSGEILSPFFRSGVERGRVGHTQATHWTSLVDQRRIGGARAQERGEDGLDAGAREPGVDGPSVEKLEVGGNVGRGRILRGAGRGGQGGYVCGLGGRMRAL